MQRKILIKGALILTFTGIITRVIGFFYRIFLSRSFGEENIGLYQLIFPVYVLAISLTSAGIQTAISRSVAHKHTLKQSDACTHILYTGMGISLFLSVLIMCIIQKYSSFIAIHLLHEPRCALLVTAISYAVPFASVHSCICGYYLGLKQVRIPALSQLIEQLIRVFFVYIYFTFFTQDMPSCNIVIAVIGLAAGELAAMCYSMYMLRTRHKILLSHANEHWKLLRSSVKELITLSVPLTANRILLNVLQSIEAISIPLQLRAFGMNTENSLRMYGVLTGMALPLILFPTALSNSVASMTLPSIAELQASKNTSAIQKLVTGLCLTSFVSGSLCTVILLICGKWIGTLLFHSSLAGNLITTLAWICPFLYTNTILTSIINGLGKPLHTFLYTSLHLSVRILSIYIYVPQKGIYGYLIGLLFSQIVLFILSMQYLYRYFKKISR